MRNKFDITGYFYEIANHKCRKYLDIKCKSSAINSPDLMVVMMNPGSSYPLDGINNNSKPSKAMPDNTQNQVMKVMVNSSFQYARVLNLSDLRTPNSRELYRFIKSSESRSFPHSIFSPERCKELKDIFAKDVPVIYGWGVNPALTELAKLAIETINHSKPTGLKKINKKYAYYHPLPRIYKNQIKWVQEVSKMLART